MEASWNLASNAPYNALGARYVTGGPSRGGGITSVINIHIACYKRPHTYHPRILGRSDEPFSRRPTRLLVTKGDIYQLLVTMLARWVGRGY